MPKVKRAVLEAGEDPPTGLQFWCPACDEAHVIRINPVSGWTWNGDVERPTIGAGSDHPGMPSIKVETYRMSAEGYAMIARGEKPPEGQRYPGSDYCCHSKVNDGMIEFCGDCTHALVNKTVPLPDWPD